MTNKNGVVKSLLISVVICTGLYLLAYTLEGGFGEIAMLVLGVILSIAFLLYIFVGIAIIVYTVLYDK